MTKLENFKLRPIDLIVQNHDEIIELLKKGERVKNIASKFDIPPDSISFHKKKLLNGDYKDKKISDVAKIRMNLDKIKRWSDKGMNQSKIADKLNVSVDSLYQAMSIDDLKEG